MKKYLLSAFAVVLAVAFSSFTNEKNSAVESGKPSPFYWYHFNGTQITSQVGSGTLTVQGAINESGCEDDLGEPVCAYGYTNPQTGLPKAPGSTDANIKETRD
jgi:hypothetical protein